MSIQSEITRITNKRDQAFTKIQTKGVAVPSNSKIDDLPGLIELIDINPNYIETEEASLDENDIIIFDSGAVEGSYNSYGNFYPNEIVYPSSVTDLRASYYNNGGANNVVSITGLGTTTTSAPGNQFRGMSNLKTVNLPRACHVYASAFRDCKKLESVELGSIGYPVVVTRSTTFQNDTQAFTITMYVNASTLAEAQAIADVGALAPWGATHATIIYKSSTTGEVLT